MFHLVHPVVIDEYFFIMIQGVKVRVYIAKLFVEFKKQPLKKKTKITA